MCVIMRAACWDDESLHWSRHSLRQSERAVGGSIFRVGYQNTCKYAHLQAHLQNPRLLSQWAVLYVMVAVTSLCCQKQNFVKDIFCCYLLVATVSTHQWCCFFFVVVVKRVRSKNPGFFLWIYFSLFQQKKTSKTSSGSVWSCVTGSWVIRLTFCDVQRTTCNA